ncbi:hypothetical protein BGZ94_003598 [Podila epigama]|nr:hypothetical protein BGZ94_003598 [Podila epigama]
MYHCIATKAVLALTFLISLVSSHLVPHSAIPFHVDSDTSLSAHQNPTRPTIRLSEHDLQSLLGPGIELNLHLNLDILKGGPQDKNQPILGRIPVHVKIHRLTIGGILAPTSSVHNVNEQSDPVNYGNWRHS